MLYSPHLKDDDETVRVYTSRAIEASPEVHLTHGGILLIAILCGGDYDEVCLCILQIFGHGLLILSMFQ